MKVRFLIIGAGPCGLGAACRLKELGEPDFVVAEELPRVGGLAASFVDERGFAWDIGGHVLFSHYEYFDRAIERALEGTGWLDHERESWIWIKGRFVPYPFQNNIRYLPNDAAWRCLKGVIAASREKRRKPKNFREWILTVFGEGIAAEFMLPYNYKVWGYPPEEFAYQWIGQRVSVIDLERIAENIVLQKDDVAWGPNNKFRFPRRGGTGAIWEGTADLVGREKFLLGRGVSAIDRARRRAWFADGEEVEYEKLLSTMPLDRLLPMVERASAAQLQRVRALKHSSCNVVGVGLKGSPKAELATKCWMYFPESDCPFYRVTLFSNYSPENVPDASRYFSLMTETCETPKKPVNREGLVAETIQGLRNTGLIDSSHEVASVWSFRAEHAYPAPTLQRDRILKQVIPYLQGLGIYSRGRFGGWKYEVANMDHVFMQGVEWADLALKEEQESTYRI